MLNAVVFPGQGSQIKGMGGELFACYDDLVDMANEILGYSIKDLCTKDSENQLNQTKYTQPALYTVNALSFLDKVSRAGKQPDYLVGHSLGEYSALFASGVFDFETGLKLVQKRGEIMSKASGGGMAAVIGIRHEEVTNLLNENGLSEIDIANYNAPSQTVISGPVQLITRAVDLFRAEKVMIIPLNVSGAFHSRYMNGAMQEFETFLQGFQFGEPSIPVIANVTARPYAPNSVKKNIVDQIVSPVRWTESVCCLMELGEIEFEEVGPGNVLTRLIQKIKLEAKPQIKHGLRS